MKRLIISLDYELRWGMDIIYGSSVNDSNIYISQTPRVVNNMLSIFSKYEIKSTWASVLAISMKSWNEYFEVLDLYGIKNDGPHFGHTSNFHNFKEFEKYYFSYNSMKTINDFELAEIGSHSFRHTYFGEDQYNSNDFILDNKICADILNNKFNIKKPCYVFPRNQIVHIDEIDRTSIVGYREVPNIFGYKNTKSTKNNRLFTKLSRFSNDVIPFVSKPSKRTTFYSVGDMHIRFNMPDLFWKIQLLKLENMIKSKESYESTIHLWWHPHNISINPSKNITRLEELLKLIRKYINNKSIESSFMSEVV
jgi:hypothetical protein|tara:strand:- start:1537 stop:2460 length:924 start_codon:yes stop_codon:yes gene_type:complete